MLKRGISLIVLVITILILTILATTVVISLSNTDIIGQANGTVNDSNLQTFKEDVDAEVVAHMTTNRGQIITKDLCVDLRNAFSNYDISCVNGKITVEGTAGIVEVDKDGVVTAKYRVDDPNDPYAGLKIGDPVEYAAQPGEYSVSEKVSTGIEYWTNYPLGKQTFSTTAAELAELNWIYIGKDEATGKHLITTEEPVNKVVAFCGKMALAVEANGKEAAINELNNLCQALYSSGDKKARSMTIEDVNRILEYTGDKGYYEKREPYSHSETVITPEAKTFAEIALENENYDMSLWLAPTPEKKPIGEYLSDYYIIEDDSNQINANRKKFVYSSTEYWLASSCACALLDQDVGYFEMRYVSRNRVGFSFLFCSYDDSNCYWCGIRPVVSL